MKIVVLVIGISGILLGLIGTIISIALPSITNNVSTSEALSGIIGGVIVLFISIIIAIAGLFLFLMRKK